MIYHILCREQNKVRKRGKVDRTCENSRKLLPSMANFYIQLYGIRTDMDYHSFPMWTGKHP